MCLIAPFPFTVQFNYTKKQQLTAEFTHEVILKGAIVEKTSCIHRIPQGCWGPCLWPWLQDGSLNKPSHIVRKYSSTYYVPPSTTTPQPVKIAQYSVPQRTVICMECQALGKHKGTRSGEGSSHRHSVPFKPWEYSLPPSMCTAALRDER